MNLVFLKLGGSLITDKTQPYSLQAEKLETLAGEIASALKENPHIHLVLGHGSGSFGHEAARRTHTRDGVNSQEEWRGFTEVWYQASRLNRFVVEALNKEKLPVVTISPVACVTARDGEISKWDINTIEKAISHNIIPIIHGDVIFDEVLGGTILSTEDLFAYLVHFLNPTRILLAGLEEGVWADFPKRTKLLERLSPDEIQPLAPDFGLTNGADVTGGMQSKVFVMGQLVQQYPELEVIIFSGEPRGNLKRAILGENLGTLIVTGR
jgi:isopentenyl phosphate kinase